MGNDSEHIYPSRFLTTAGHLKRRLCHYKDSIKFRGLCEIFVPEYFVLLPFQPYSQSVHQKAHLVGCLLSGATSNSTHQIP